MGERREYGWEDRDGCSGCILGHDEVRLQQPDTPEDVVAMIHVGEPPKPHPNGIDTIIDANPVYLTAEQAVDAALFLLDAAQQATWKDWGPPVGPTTDRAKRWQLHVHASSINDMTIWIENVEGGYRATEVESGVSGAVAPTQREAMANYWEGRFDG